MKVQLAAVAAGAVLFLAGCGDTPETPKTAPQGPAEAPTPAPVVQVDPKACAYGEHPEGPCRAAGYEWNTVCPELNCVPDDVVLPNGQTMGDVKKELPKLEEYSNQLQQNIERDCNDAGGCDGLINGEPY